MKRLLWLLPFLWLTACGVFESPPSALDPISPSVQGEALPDQTSPLADPVLVPATPLPSDDSLPVASSETVSPPTIEPTAEPTALPSATPVPGFPTIPAPSQSADPPQSLAVVAATPPPQRDDTRLAAAYRGVDTAALALATPAAPLEYVLGDTDAFYVGNVDDNTINLINAQLLAIGQFAYYWFETGDGALTPDAEKLRAAAGSFDEIFSTANRYFGDGVTPGERVHIVHASPGTLCVDADNCRLAGYFSPQDLLPAAVNPTSNERPMFVMNSVQFESVLYLNTLAHELRHMLGSAYDAGDEDWFIEGAATLAEDLTGFIDIPQSRSSLFLTNPDQQLNSWTEGSSNAYYGHGYLLNRFIFDRLGPGLYREFSKSPAQGLAALDDVAVRYDLSLTGQSVWLDWLASMAMLDENGLQEPFWVFPKEYYWGGPPLAPVFTTNVNALPATYETTVNQFGADYYTLPSTGTINIQFTGAPEVPLLEAEPPTGAPVWYARRANYSNPRLTRTLDLSGVSAATLYYRVYADIELGYDFAYVSVSTDDGQTWIPLVAPGMQGLATGDDPSNSAFTERFYTGRTRQWLEERVDLTPFAGQAIQLRFEYVTDPILTWSGFALDDIAVPEIGFYDTADTLDPGWQAEGFERVMTSQPQNWHLQLITFLWNGSPVVEQLPVSADGRAEFTFEVPQGTRRPVLVVAASAPDTQQAAAYTVQITGP